MQEKQLYEYAVIRIVPRVEREEFINIGVIMFSKEHNYIDLRYFIDTKKISLFSDEIDFDFIDKSLETFRKICHGTKSGGKIASLDIPERFRWITAVKSSCIQTSRPHPGFSDNLDETLEKLFKELVL